MKDKFPEIYKNKINNLKSKVQKDFYYHATDFNQDNINGHAIRGEQLSKTDLINKINNIFKRPDYVYQADVNIMYKNGKNIDKKIIGFKDNYIMTSDGDRIFIDEISNIK
ncbi:unknown [Clostridium sp. CAG:594]|nr:unknown [Clostridium sp. CAG:594]